MTTHRDHKYSVTIHTDDLAVVNCFRALSKYAQRTGNNNIPWGGTKDIDWKRDSHKVTFRFSSREHREGYINELNRLLPRDLWRKVERSDNDPAIPTNQRK